MRDTLKFKRCLVGGTFDRFHSGHELLLRTAFQHADVVEIHIMCHPLAEQKSPHILSFDERYNQVSNWLESQHLTSFELHELEDIHGPAPSHPTADCIVATQETEIECHRINSIRIINHLLPLEIITVPHLPSIDGGIISSTRIRNGEIDQDGAPWFESRYLNHVLHMTPDVGQMLKEPFGILYEGPEDEPLIALEKMYDDFDFSESLLIAVGDVTTKSILDHGGIPDVAIIDWKTKREELASNEKIDLSFFKQHIEVCNPPGQLTPELLHAIQTALISDDHVAIVVDGEEDLAPLFVHLGAPLGSVVLYGQPHKGIVAQKTTLDSKNRCKSILDLFEVGS